jgi:ankyrin repeat protein
VSAAVAAARLASFKYGAAVAPAVGAFGQPIQTRPALRRGDDKTVRGERNENENENKNASARSPPRRRVAPLGHNVDPVTLLKLADAELTRAVERDGLSRGEVLVSLKPNADANANAKAETDHARNAIAFSDPTALPAPPTKEDLDLLFKFCRKGEYELCRDLFKKRGIDPNTRDAHGNTPLIVACQNGAGRVAKLCLRRGADVNVYNAKRNTALHFAATFGFEKLASWLVENGADKHAVNDNGKKPFDEGL